MESPFSISESSPFSSPPSTSSPSTRSASPGDPPPSKRQKKTSPHRRRFRYVDKVAYIMSALDKIGLSVGDFLDELENRQEHPDFRRAWLQYRRKAYTKGTLDRATIKAILKQNGIDEIAHHSRKELDKLAHTESFGQFRVLEERDMATVMDDRPLEFLKDMVPDVKRLAPQLMRFLALLSRPVHKSPSEPAADLKHPQLLWVSMFLYSMRRNKCHNILCEQRYEKEEDGDAFIDWDMRLPYEHKRDVPQKRRLRVAP